MYGCFARVFPFTRCVCTRVVVCVARIRGRLVREANCISPLGFCRALPYHGLYLLPPAKDARNGIVSAVPSRWNLKEPTGVFNCVSKGVRVYWLVVKKRGRKVSRLYYLSR